MNAFLATSQEASIHPGGWALIILAGIMVLGIIVLIIQSWWANRPPNLNTPRKILDHHVALLMYHDTKTPDFKLAATMFAQLFRNNVPDTGPASTIQAEVIRCVDRLASEERRNGNLNWNHSSDGYYQNLADFLKLHLVELRPFPEPQLSAVASDLALITTHGTIEQDAGEVAVAFGRLIIAAVSFFDLHPEPVPLPR